MSHLVYCNISSQVTDFFTCTAALKHGIMYILCINYRGIKMQIESRVQKWGNGLALRMSGALRTIPNLKKGDLLTITINENGFSAVKPTNRKFTEQELLSDITVSNAHADLAPNLLNSEYE